MSQIVQRFFTQLRLPHFLNISTAYQPIHQLGNNRLSFPSWLPVVCRLQVSLFARISILWIWMKFNFTYSGIVLVAEATLSLDSFFFIALEAIFVKFQRFSKTKLDRWSLTKQSNCVVTGCHGLSRQPSCSCQYSAGSFPRENQFQARENRTTRDISITYTQTANIRFKLRISQIENEQIKTPQNSSYG